MGQRREPGWIRTAPPQPQSAKTRGAANIAAAGPGSEGRPAILALGLWQGIESFLKSRHRKREADPFLGRLKNDEGGPFATLHLIDQFIFHHHFGDATSGKTADKTGTP